MASKDINRIGKISSINYQKGTARITYEDKSDSTTAMFSFLAWQYWMPKVGDQVLVAHLSNGSCSAVILGPVWHDGHRPPEGFEGLYRKDYNHQAGLAFERYDAKEKAYSEEVTGTITIKPSESWTLQVGSCTITANKDGSISITAPAGISVTTPTVTVTGDVIAGGVSLDHHTHPGDSGGTTGQPS